MEIIEVDIKCIVGNVMEMEEEEEFTFWLSPDADGVDNFGSLGFGIKKLNLFDIPVVSVGCFGGDEVHVKTIREKPRKHIAEAIMKAIDADPSRHSGAWKLWIKW